MPSNYDSKDSEGILEGWTPGEPYDPPHKEKELAGRLKERFQEAYNYRVAWDRQWELNRLYQKGQQLIIRNRTTGEVFRLPQDDSHRLISVHNVIRPTSRSLLGKLTRVVPTCTVVPPTDDVSDMQGAMTADSLLQFHRRKEKLDTVYIEANRDVVTFGSGIIKLAWDREGGFITALCETCGYQSQGDSEVGEECPQCVIEAELESLEAAQVTVDTDPEMIIEDVEIEAETRPVGKLEAVKEGDVRVECIDLRDFFVDPSATDLSEAQWVCHRVAVPVNVIRQRFPKRGKYVNTESGIYTDRHVSLVQDIVNSRQEVRYLEDHVYLYEFHERPTKKNQEGRVIFFADNVILNPDDMESPYYNLLGRFPYYVFRWEKNRGEFWGESYIEQAWTIQRELNILLTQMREHRDLTNRPKLFVPLNSRINIDEIDTTAGQIIHYNPIGGPPRFGELPAMPNYVHAELSRLESEIRTHASVTEQEAGSSEARVSGRYAAIIEAEASQQIGPTLKLNNHEWCEMHRGILLLCQEFYTNERRWTVTGSDRPQTFYFENLNLNPGFDISLEQEDSMSQNAAVRLNQAIELAKIGIFTDQKTGQLNIKAFARAARLKLAFIGPDEEGSERATAAAIPNQMENGMQYQPQPWDDVNIFAEELLGWLRGPGRNASPGIVQQVQQLWQTYVQLATKGQVGMQTQPPGGAPQPRPNPAAAGSTQVLSDANEQVAAADRAAESVAKIQPTHEG